MPLAAPISNSAARWQIGAKPGLDEQGQQRMEQFDGSGDKPLKVTLGENRIIKGMERGMLGQCQGEQRNILIPPQLAFDDPTVRFNSKPVPDGTMILYQVINLSLPMPLCLYQMSLHPPFHPSIHPSSSLPLPLSLS